jgi:hypothetical protein
VGGWPLHSQGGKNDEGDREAVSMDGGYCVNLIMHYVHTV